MSRCFRQLNIKSNLKYLFCYLISILILTLFLEGVAFAGYKDELKKPLKEIIVAADRAEIVDRKVIPDPGLTVKARATAEDIKAINAVTIEDTLRYLPNIDVRRRFIADPNGVVACRGSQNFQTPRVMVFTDGFPIHYLLQSRFNGAPRWNLLAPDEVFSSEVLYGPFNAKYSGNSMGCVIDVKTRQPQKRETVVQTSFFTMPYKFFGTDDTFNGYKTFISHGDKIGKFSYYAFYNRIENDGQPQTLRSERRFSTPTTESEATGAFRNEDSRNRDQIIYGDTGPEAVTTDLFKFKARYDFSSQFAVRTLIGFTDRNREVTERNNYLKDASGNTIWGDNNNSTTDAQFIGQAFNVKNNNFGLEERDHQDLFVGLGFDGDLASGWAYDAAFSYYTILENFRRQSDENPNDPLFDKSGRITELEDTGWETADIKLGTDSFLGRKDLSFGAGYHFAHYTLKTVQNNSNDYSAGSKDSFRNSSGGDTSIHGLYAQAEWRFMPNWDFVFGGRQEWWNSYNGFKNNGSGNQSHPDRSESTFSPKFSLGFKPAENWQLRASISRAVRFPIVEELFSNISTQTSTALADADLKPEDGFHKTFMVERQIDKGVIQFSVYEDDIEDVIFNQVDAISQVSAVLNIDRVRTRGAEFVFNQKSFFLRDFDFNFNVGYIDSEIITNTRNSSVEGNRLPRVPRWRLKAVSTYHITPAWDSTLAVRYSSNQFGRLQNDDTGQGFGGVSDFTVLDFKTSYTMDNGLIGSFGIDNLSDDEYFVFHMFPQRTFYIDAKWRF
jgi:iron complex outermembrane recepter protein